jgi:hypothetical protein
MVISGGTSLISRARKTGSSHFSSFVRGTCDGISGFLQRQTGSPRRRFLKKERFHAERRFENVSTILMISRSDNV